MFVKLTFVAAHHIWHWFRYNPRNCKRWKYGRPALPSNRTMRKMVTYSLPTCFAHATPVNMLGFWRLSTANMIPCATIQKQKKIPWPKLSPSKLISWGDQPPCLIVKLNSKILPEKFLLFERVLSMSFHGAFLIFPLFSSILGVFSQMRFIFG